MPGKNLAMYTLVINVYSPEECIESGKAILYWEQYKRYRQNCQTSQSNLTPQYVSENRKKHYYHPQLM